MRFILVHGAWHYGELWEPVRKHLEAAGHEVHTPTAGGLRADDDKHVDLRGAAAPIIEHIKKNQLTDYVLVGHSWGGYLISRVAIEMPKGCDGWYSSQLSCRDTAARSSMKFHHI